MLGLRAVPPVGVYLIKYILLITGETYDCNWYMAARLLSAHHNYQVERPFFTTVPENQWRQQKQTKANKNKQQQTCKHNKKTTFWFSLNFQNIIRRSPQASPTKNWKIKSAVKEKIRDLSSSSINFRERGGAGPAPDRPARPRAPSLSEIKRNAA